MLSIVLSTRITPSQRLQQLYEWSKSLKTIVLLTKSPWTIVDYLGFKLPQLVISVEGEQTKALQISSKGFFFIVWLSCY